MLHSQAARIRNFYSLRLRIRRFRLSFFQELPNAYDCAANGTLADFLDIIARGYAQGIETSVKRFERRLGLDVRADATGGTVLDVDGSSHRDLVAFAIRVERVKSRGLHQTDHVGRGIDRGQLRVVRGQSVFELDSLSRLTARADGNLLSDAYSQKATCVPGVVAAALRIRACIARTPIVRS